MKIARLAFAASVAAALALPAHAQKECSKADMAAAEKAVERVVNYSGLNKAWKDYGHCDTGAVDEVFTDAILRLMVEWKNVDIIAQDMRDPGYKAFIHKHLSSPAAKDDRQSIFSRAKASCPVTQGRFCEELIEVVKAPPKASAKDDLLAPLPTIPAPKK
jgi:hypothetical protein